MARATSAPRTARAEDLRWMLSMLTSTRRAAECPGKDGQLYRGSLVPRGAAIATISWARQAGFPRKGGDHGDHRGEHRADR